MKLPPLSWMTVAIGWQAKRSWFDKLTMRTEIDRPVARQGRAMPGEPALGGVALAILLFRPVLRGDELGRQRQNLLVSGCHQAGAEKGMEVLDAAVRAAALGALRAMDLARAEVLRPVERNQHPPAQALERCQRVGGGDGRHGRHEQPVKRRWSDPVQHQADVVVRRDGRHPEQRLAVRSAVPLRQGPLMRQERWASHEKQRERRQADVSHRIGATVLRSLALVRKTGAHLSQIRYQAFECTHPSGESCVEPTHKLKSLDIAWSLKKPTPCGKSDSVAAFPLSRTRLPAPASI